MVNKNILFIGMFLCLVIILSGFVAAECVDPDKSTDENQFLTKTTVGGIEDYCLSFDGGVVKLVEGKCLNDAYNGVQINCGTMKDYGLGDNYVCEEGACVQKVNIDCVDSDRDNNILVKGTVTKGNTYFEDKCSDSTNVMEAYCDPNTEEVKYDSKGCVNDMICVDGKCQAKEAAGKCSNPDEGADEFYKKTSVMGSEDHCQVQTGVNYLVEYTCSGKDNVGQNFVKCDDFKKGYVCKDGACVLKGDLCVDSDINEAEPQNVEGEAQAGEMKVEDTCDGVKIKEAVCDENNNPVYLSLDCSLNRVCKDGVCVLKGDLDGNGNVDVSDVNMLKSSFSKYWDSLFSNNLKLVNKFLNDMKGNLK